MLNEPYKVVTIPDTLDTAESLGTRTKYWVRIGGDSERWLLKIPRKGTGEHWAEKIVAEIGNLIGVDCAQVELARYAEDVVFGAGTGDNLDGEHAYGDRPDQLGTICRSFGREEHDEEKQFLFAFHGVGALQFVIDGYDVERKFGQRDHNLRNIVGGMAEVMSVNSDDPKHRRREQPPLQRRIVERLWQRPAQTLLLGAADVLPHRRRRHLQASRYRPGAQTRRVVQPQSLSCLAHGQPLVRHREPLP